MKKRNQIKVRRVYWQTETGIKEPVIIIQRGKLFIRIPFHKARKIVDQVHDLCDQRDTELRKQ